MRPSVAARAADATAFSKAAVSGIRWSDGMTSTIACGSRRSARQAARVTAASVSRPCGSSAISISRPTSAAWSETRNRDVPALTTIGSAKISPPSRSSVR